jgi:alpha-maltose-1-phosphate synthase
MTTEALLAHPGTQYAPQLARQLFRHRNLYQFWTGFALAKEAWFTQALQQSLPKSWNKKIANRVICGVPDDRLRITPLLEWKAIRQLRKNISSQRVLHRRNELFQERIPQAAIDGASAVIGFDTSSWIIGEKTRRLGKAFFLDQSIAHPLVNQATSQVVANSFPEWSTTVESRAPEVLACENREHELATKVIVASSYSKQTLVSQGVPADKILVNPYGVDTEVFHPPAKPRLRQPLRFLFLGLVSARKGVPLLLKAWQTLNPKNCELWLVGPVSDKERSLIPSVESIKLKGKYPFEDLPALLRQCDVLVFPSYCEGFALVLLEALASGMPIITTEATAGPDLIKDEEAGLLIPSGSVEALCESITYFIDHPKQLDEMSKSARRCAEKFTWESYGDRWQEILAEFA